MGERPPVVEVVVRTVVEVVDTFLDGVMDTS
jgi:hypothetical protein